MFGFGTRFRDYVFANNGRIFCVDTVETFDCGWETMVGEVADYEIYNAMVQDWLYDNEIEELTDADLKEILSDTEFDWDLFNMTKRYRNENSAYKGHLKTMKELNKKVVKGL